jgi:hypothetical protein
VKLRGADKSLAFLICSETKTFFLGWVKEVRTMCGAQGRICRVNIIFNPLASFFCIKLKTYQPSSYNPQTARQLNVK